MTELTFKSDTSQRKSWFTGISFSHPAKLVLPLELWLIDNYTMPGELILDPMAGSGTILVACSMGRHVIAVELEQKFVDMMKGNWAKIQERGPMMGYEMGRAQIIQGDARKLPTVLADSIITSPPYAESLNDIRGRATSIDGSKSCDWHPGPYSQVNQSQSYGDNPANLGNLKYGDIDAVITSPPYEASITGEPGIDWSKCTNEKGGTRDFTKEPGYAGRIARHSGYAVDAINIGNLKSDSYLAAMLQVYQNCFAVLKPGGLMVLVVKPFVHNRQVVRLEEDTRKLCEQVGFLFLDQHVRKLTNMSFWRTIYYQKNPTVEKVDKEYILVFTKPPLVNHKRI